MKRFILAGAAALALAATPGITQDATAGAYDMNQAQQQMFMTWPDDRRIMYTRWPADLQAYYWTLTPQEQTGWWVLTDDQRVRLYAMTPELRRQAWSGIMAQMAGQPAAVTRAAATSDIRWVSNAVVQATPYDAGPPTGDVPICNATDYDNCINAWEAGKRGPNVTKPLSYWPGPKNDPRAGE